MNSFGGSHDIAPFDPPNFVSLTSRAVLTGFAILVMGFALTLTLSRSGIGCFLLAMVLSAFNVLRRQASTTKGRLVGTYLALVFVAAVAWVGIDAIAFQEIVEFSLQMPGNAAFFTVLCAVAVRRASVKRR